MKRSGFFSKLLAVSGTVLAWFPILATLLTSAGVTARSGMFRMDYLMPAELFPAAFLGGLLLLWAALRVGVLRAPVAWGLGGMIVLLVGSQAIAVVTGLASGETQPEGFVWIAVLALLAGYVLALILTAVTGARLVSLLYAHSPNNGNITPTSA